MADEQADSVFCRQDDEDDNDGDWSHSLGEEHSTFKDIDTSSDVKPSSSLNEKCVVRMELNDHKAGMTGLDKEKINQIIYEASKGSKFYDNEKKKEERVQERIMAMQENLIHITENEKTAAVKEVDSLLAELEAKRDLDRIIVHIDMDAFYAAVEIRDQPELKDIPMAVGGMSMLSTSNYAARRYGVRAAMPGFIAKKLCPHLRIVPIHFSKYREVSGIIKDILKEYDPNLVSASLDEAYLDLTDYTVNRSTQNEHNAQSGNQDECNPETAVVARRLHLLSLAESIVEELRKRIHTVTRLTASAGIGCNTLLAKIGSDMNKPNGQFCVPANKHSILEFIQGLPIRKISGVGRVSEQVLKSVGIIKCRDIYEQRHLIQLLFSNISCRYYMRVCLGISSNSVLNDEDDRKSMSRETTFREKSRPDDLYAICKSLCNQLEADLKEEDLCSRCVTIKLKLTTFQILSRSKSIGAPVHLTEDIYTVAKGLLDAEMKKCLPQPLKLRLLGVRTSSLSCLKDEMPRKKQRVLQFDRKNAVRTMKAHVDEDPAINPGHLAPKAVTGEDVTEVELCELPGCSDSTFQQEQCVTCPVCGVYRSDNSTINKHIDSCLNRGTIKEILSESRLPKLVDDSGQGKKRKQLRPSGSDRPTPRDAKKSPHKNGVYGIQSYFRS